MSGRYLTVIFFLQGFEHINTLLRLHGAVIHLLVVGNLLCCSLETVLDGLSDGFLWDFFISVCPVSIILLLTLLTRRVYIITKIKNFAHFSVFCSIITLNVLFHSEKNLCGHRKHFCDFSAWFYLIQTIVPSQSF